jgi:hypothetical protein
MTYITYPCWACQSISSEQAKCRICTTPSTRKPKKESMQKPYNIRQLNYLYTIAASTLMRIMEVYDFDMRAIEAEIEDLVGMTEASSNDDTCPITVISHDLPWTTPSVVLHGAENEHPTMDVNTFRAVGEEVDGSNALRVVVCPTRFSKRKHTRGEKCAKCCEAAFASYRFGKCMKELKAGRSAMKSVIIRRCSLQSKG